MALAILPLVQLPPWGKTALAVSVAMSACLSIRRHALRLGQNAVVGITLREEGKIDLVHRDGNCLVAEIASVSAVFPQLTALVLNNGGKRVALPLMFDSMDHDSFRRLQTWLRWSSFKN